MRLELTLVCSLNVFQLVWLWVLYRFYSPFFLKCVYFSLLYHFWYLIFCHVCLCVHWSGFGVSLSYFSYLCVCEYVSQGFFCSWSCVVLNLLVKSFLFFLLVYMFLIVLRQKHQAGNTHTHTHTHTHIYIYIYRYTHTHTHTQTYIDMCIHIYYIFLFFLWTYNKHIYICMYECIYIYMYVCVCVCVCMCVYIYIYIYINTYILTCTDFLSAVR